MVICYSQDKLIHYVTLYSTFPSLGQSNIQGHMGQASHLSMRNFPHSSGYTRISWVDWYTAWQQKRKLLKALYKDNTARTSSQLNFTVYLSSFFELHLLPRETKWTLNKFYSVLLETAGWDFSKSILSELCIFFLRHIPPTKSYQQPR